MRFNENAENCYKQAWECIFFEGQFRKPGGGHHGGICATPSGLGMMGALPGVDRADQPQALGRNRVAVLWSLAVTR
jgi:hypothetical protein